MAKIVSVHGLRGGTGKTNITANMAFSLAASGKRVGVVDADISSPGLHHIFGVDVSRLEYTLNDYLWGTCAVEETATDVGQSLTDDAGDFAVSRGALFLVPARNKVNEIARILRQDHDGKRLAKGYLDLAESLKLDVLFLDTHPGLNADTLLALNMSDVLFLVLRPDKQDFQDTSLALEVARKLKVRRTYLVLNKVVSGMNVTDMQERVESLYGVSVAGILPLSMTMARMGSNALFALKEPSHVLSREIASIASKALVEEEI